VREEIPAEFSTKILRSLKELSKQKKEKEKESSKLTHQVRKDIIQNSCYKDKTNSH